MNSVIVYKQFSLGEGLADLFAPEIRNLEAFKASVASTTKKFCSTFGYGKCKDWKDNDSWKQTYERDC